MQKQSSDPSDSSTGHTLSNPQIDSANSENKMFLSPAERKLTQIKEVIESPALNSTNKVSKIANIIGVPNSNVQDKPHVLSSANISSLQSESSKNLNGVFSLFPWLDPLNFESDQSDDEIPDGDNSPMKNGNNRNDKCFSAMKFIILWFSNIFSLLVGYYFLYFMFPFLMIPPRSLVICK